MARAQFPIRPNVPGVRVAAVSWSDPSGNLWLFGGLGSDSNASFGALNDLWKYTPATNTWTWVSGSNVVNQYGVYGPRGTADLSNVPGARGSVSTHNQPISFFRLIAAKDGIRSIWPRF